MVETSEENIIAAVFSSLPSLRVAVFDYADVDYNHYKWFSFLHRDKKYSYSAACMANENKHSTNIPVHT